MFISLSWLSALGKVHHVIRRSSRAAKRTYKRSLRLEKYRDTNDSKFKLINVAAKRCRELRSGARPRLQHFSSRNAARIALEEVKAGLVKFETLPPQVKKSIDNTEGTPVAL